MRNLKFFSIISIIMSLLLSVIVVHAQISPPKNSEQFLGSGQEFSYGMNSGMNENLQGKILEMTPEYWFFGSKPAGADSTKEFIVSNIGTESFNVIIPDMRGEFFVGNPGSTLTVAPGTSQNIVFGLHPTSWGFKFKTVNISNQSDNAPNKKVYLSGIGGDMILDVTPYSWDYGIVLKQTNSDKVFQLKNVSGYKRTVARLSIEGSASVFSLLTPPATPFNLDMNATINVTIRFNPTAPDTQIDFFKVNFYEPRPYGTSDSFMVFLKGRGGITGKILKVAPESYNFGSVTVGKDSVKQFLLINQGTENINVNSIAVGPGEFSLVEMPGTSFTLAPGDTDTVSVSFGPVSMGLKLDTLKIWNDSDNAKPIKKVPLQGTGVHKILTVTPDSSYDFGSVSIKDSTDKDFILKNEGNQSFQVTGLSIQITAGAADEFKLASPPATTFTLSPGATKNVKIRFSPLTGGLKEAIFKIENNSDNASPVKEIFLKSTGAGGTGTLTITPESWSLGAVVKGVDTVQVFRLKNDGDQAVDVTGLSVELVAGEPSVFSLANPPVTPFVLNAGTTQFIMVRFKTDATVAPGNKSGIFKIENNSGNASPIKEVPLTATVDSTKIEVSYPNPVSLNTEIPVSIVITGALAIKEVKLFYRSGGSPNFSALLVNLSGDSLTQTIPADSVTSRGIEFYIYAKVTFNEMIETKKYSVQVRVTGEGVVKQGAQPAGNEQTAYRLISLPLDLDNKNPQAVLEDDLGKYDKTKWRFFELREDQKYYEYPYASELIPGKAFWLIVKDDGRLIDTGAGKSNPTDNEYTIPLHKGWSLIANPFNFSIPVSNCSFRNSDQIPLLRSYSGYWNDPDSARVQLLIPFEGYAVKVASADLFVINPDLSSRKGNLTKDLASTSGAEILWAIHILARCQAAIDVDNYAGVSLTACNGWDELDYPEPPVIGDYISVNFPHTDWDTQSDIYCTDFRPEPFEGDVWQFNIHTNIGDVVQLTFDDVDNVPLEYDVWLIDEAVKVTKNLRQINSYAIAGGDAHDPKQLILVVGKKDFVGEKLDAIQLMPGSYELCQNIPNPFNPTTTIRYGLPAEGNITLKVFNLLGEEVVTLVDNDRQPAGYYVTVWNGRNAQGQPVANGIYVYQLRVNSFFTNKKMALLR